MHTLKNCLAQTKYTLQIVNWQNKVDQIVPKLKNQEIDNAKNDSYFGDPFPNPNISIHASFTL